MTTHLTTSWLVALCVTVISLAGIGFPSSPTFAYAILPAVFPVSTKSKVEKASTSLYVEQPQQSVPQSQLAPSIDETIANFVAADNLVEEPKIIPVYKEIFIAAYATAPEIQIARNLKEQKSEERYTAWAHRISPKVNASVSQVREFNVEDDETTDTEDTDIYSYDDGEEYADWSFDVNVPIYRRTLGVQVNVAETEEALADNNLQIKKQELHIRLQGLLADYLESCYRLVNIQNSIRLSRNHVDRIFRGYELRDQTRLQLLRAQANLKELEAKRDLDEHNKEVTFRSLLDFTGLPEDFSTLKKLDELLDDEVQIAGCINSLAEVDNKYAFIEPFVDQMDDQQRQLYFIDHSLLYYKILLEKQLADHQATTFTQNEYPDLAIRGFYDRLDDTQFTKFNGEGSLALVLSVPLFSGGTLFSTHKTQTQAQHIAEVNKYTDLRAKIHTIENNKKLILSLRNIYTTQQINLRQQQEIVILSAKSYKIKQTSMQDLLTSQNKLIDAKNALMQTTNRLAALYRQFAWELGTPFPTPEIEQAF